MISVKNPNRIVLVPISEPTTPPVPPRIPLPNSFNVPPRSLSAKPVSPGAPKPPGNPVQAVLCDPPVRCKRNFIPVPPRLQKEKSATLTQPSKSARTPTPDQP